MAALVLVSLPLLPYVEFPIPYDKHVWVERGRLANDWTRIRGHMAIGLVQSKRLIGMTQAEVYEFLDPPEPTDKFRDQWDIVYWVGKSGAIDPVHSQWLVMRLGAEGKVSDVRLVDD